MLTARREKASTKGQLGDLCELVETVEEQGKGTDREFEIRWFGRKDKLMRLESRSLKVKRLTQREYNSASSPMCVPLFRGGGLVIVPLPRF